MAECTSLLYLVVRVRCRRTESSRSLSHLLMSFLYFNHVYVYLWTINDIYLDSILLGRSQWPYNLQNTAVLLFLIYFFHRTSNVSDRAATLTSQVYKKLGPRPSTTGTFTHLCLNFTQG